MSSWLHCDVEAAFFLFLFRLLLPPFPSLVLSDIEEELAVEDAGLNGSARLSSVMTFSFPFLLAAADLDIVELLLVERGFTFFPVLVLCRGKRERRILNKYFVVIN